MTLVGYAFAVGGLVLGTKRGRNGVAWCGKVAIVLAVLGLAVYGAHAAIAR